MRSLYWVCSFFPVSQGYSCVGVDRHDDYSADSSTSLAQCGFVGGFLPNFAIFALVSVHLGKFGLSSLASIGNSNAFLCQLSLPIHLYLSPLVSSFGGQSWQPTFSGGFCSVCFGGITSVAEVLSLLFLLLLRVLSALAAPPWCVSSASLGTPAVPLGVCGLLPFWGSPAGYSFPNGRPSGSAPLPPVSWWL